MHKTTYRTTPWMLSLLIGVLSAGANQPARAVTPWVTGDVFAGVGNGTYQIYDNTGVFKEAISDGLDGITARGKQIAQSGTKRRTGILEIRNVAEPAIGSTPVRIRLK